MIAEVLTEIVGIDKTFNYNVPDYIKDIKVGKRVTIPFTNRKLEGFVIKLKPIEEYNYKMKDIIDVIDEEPVLNEEMLKIGNYISKKTISSLTSSYQTMLPKALKAKKGVFVNKKYETYIKLINDSVSSAKQLEIIEILKKRNLVLKSELEAISKSAVSTLIKNKNIEEVKKEVYRLNQNIDKIDNKVTLNEEQKDAYDKIVNNINTFKPFLLFGVTGSGKTEVYMHVIEEVLKNNKEAIVLVPEISLTPQMVRNFKQRFGEEIAVLHSRLSEGEKYDEWRKITKKEVKVAIGARSAIFAPFENIGVIIIDEEHSDTYKQENNPKYDAKDIALLRGKYHNCPVIFGSATPSIETYTKAKLNKFELLKLENRINKNMPLVKLVDMKDEIRKGNKIISEDLYNNLNEIIQKQEQAIILLNRRGYSTVITCHNCGYVDKCPNCDIPLVYHKNQNKMTCHYCNYTKPKLTKCPSCKSEDINNFGLGTEKLEEELKKINGAKVIRMDVDTTRKKGSHEEIIKSFKEEKYNILIGTQMIAKGLDFAKVTLVGVINGDASLNIPDFRSAERTFCLLNQVSGRSGRSNLPGKVIIQSYNIDHYSIVKACKNDYIGFYEEELEIRKKLNYPPYFNLTLIKISGKDEKEVNNQSNKIANYLKNNLKNIVILGPSYANMPKINNVYYMQIIIKYKKTEEVYNLLVEMNNLSKQNKKVKVDIDFNPLRV